MERLTVLYDASCGFCFSCRRWLEAQPAYIPLEFVPAESPAAERLFPGLSATAGDELTVVGDDGSIYRGGAAWIVCLWALEDYRALAQRLSTPSLYPLARQAFQFVSQRRREISQALALRPEEEVAQQVAQVPPLSCGRKTSSSFPVARQEPPRGRRIALPAMLLLILFLIAFVLLANHSQSVLFWAVDRGIVSRGATLRLLGLDLEKTLESSARRGDARRVRSLLEAGANPRRGPGRNALVEAAIHDHKTVVAVLRSAGAQADISDDRGRTALMLQAENGDLGAVKALLAAGADPNARDDNGRVPLFFALESNFGCNQELAQLLLAAGADPNARGKAGQTALMSAVSNRLTDLACSLLAAGADPNARDETGGTALMEVRGLPPLGKALLEAGADPNLADHEGQTPLHWAAQTGHPEDVGILLAWGANAGAETKDGRTPLLYAIEYGERDTRTSADRLEIAGRLFAATPTQLRDRDIAAALRLARANHDDRMQILLTQLSLPSQSSSSSRR